MLDQFAYIFSMFYFFSLISRKALKRIQTDKIKDYNDFKLHLKIINREKNILRQLSADNNTQQHPNVIKFFDEIKFNDYTCLITEYCPVNKTKKFLFFLK